MLVDKLPIIAPVILPVAKGVSNLWKFASSNYPSKALDILKSKIKREGTKLPLDCTKSIFNVLRAGVMASSKHLLPQKKEVHLKSNQNHPSEKT